MNGRVFALLLHDRPEPLSSLKRTLRDLWVETYSVGSCEEAQRLISQTQPHLVFTDTSLLDGSWVDVVNLAEKETVPPNVIVVSPIKDLKLYLSAIERGAFDFVLPPFEHQSLEFVVGSAVQDARNRWKAKAHAAVA